MFDHKLFHPNVTIVPYEVYYTVTVQFFGRTYRNPHLQLIP